MMYTKQTHPKLYNSWRGMRGRCNNKNQADYKYYGGKGISVYPAWASFEAFAKWAIKVGYEEGLTIDRIDSSKNYEPKNCQWVSHKENVIRANEDRYRNRYLDAYAYWRENTDITGTELGSIFGVSYSSGCRWIREFKKL